MSLKQCKVCNEKKSTDDYYIKRDTKDGLQSACKQCQKLRQVDASKITYNNNLSTGFTVEYKKCSVCGEVKSRDFFTKSRRKKSGLISKCKMCESMSRVWNGIITNKLRNVCGVNSLIRGKRLDKPSNHVCAFGGCNTFAQEYHHIIYNDLSVGDHTSVITPVCKFHHNIVGVNKNNGVELSDKFSLKIKIVSNGAPHPSTITYIKE